MEFDPRTISQIDQRLAAVRNTLENMLEAHRLAYSTHGAINGTTLTAMSVTEYVFARVPQEELTPLTKKGIGVLADLLAGALTHIVELENK
jgi:hypothetical protein